MLSFALAKESDISDILKIEKENFINPWKEKDFAYEINENPFNKVILLKKGLEIIGYIDFIITFTSSSISKIAVLKKYQGMGYGQNLFDYMLEDLTKNYKDEVETITLEVRKSNHKAIKFYERNGFRYICDKENYYSDGESALYMVKGLI